MSRSVKKFCPKSQESTDWSASVPLAMSRLRLRPGFALRAHCKRDACAPVAVLLLVLAGVLALSAAGCALTASRQGVPPEVEAVVATVSEDAAEGRYEKIHNEASEEWRKDATLEKTTAVFSTVKEKLGSVKSRQLHAAAEQNTSNSSLPGHSFVLTYDTKFERGDGMETFTLVERNGHWLLAKYFVNSMGLQ